MKRMLLTVLLALVAASARAYDNLEDLMKDFARQESAALKDYVAAHPDADDAESASMYLRQMLYMSGENEELLGLLLKDYEKLAAKPDESEMRDVGGAVGGIAKIYQELGRKDDAKAFLDRVRKDFGGDKASEDLTGILDHLTAALGTPGVGDTMSVKFKAVDGREVDLASMTGKVVLVDFWATWCGPCVRELPNVKKAFDAYHERGFEIIGISLDDDEAKLKKFVSDRGIPWPQYFDGKGWESELGQQFGIQSIPSTFLVGADGKIVATDLHGAELTKKLEELLPAAKQ